MNALEDIRMLGRQGWIDLLESLDRRETETLPDRVVIREPVVPPSHDIKCSKIPAREFEGPKQLVTDIGAKDGVLLLRHLGCHPHEELFHQRWIFQEVARVPPSGTEAIGGITRVGSLKVTLPIPAVESWWHHGVTEAEGSRLEGVGNARMNFGLVTLIWLKVIAQERRQKLVHDYALVGENTMVHFTSWHKICFSFL